MCNKSIQRFVCIFMIANFLLGNSLSMAFAAETNQYKITNEFIAAKSIMNRYESDGDVWKAGNMEISNEKTLALLGAVNSFEFGISIATHSVLGNTYELNIQMTEKETEADERMNQVIGEIITDSMSTRQKITAIHDWVTLNTIYNENPANQEIDVHQLTGPVLYGQGVCDGYAKTLMEMCHKVNIPCLLIVSRKINHAWNLVYDGSGWKMVDATWDDPVPDMPGRSLHQYLLFSEDTFGEKYLFDEERTVTLSAQEYMDFAEYYYSESVLEMNTEHKQLVLDAKAKTRKLVEYVIQVLLWMQVKSLDLPFGALPDFPVNEYRH